MEGAGWGVGFLGDLDDPWVAAIAEVLPRDSVRVGCAEELPEIWPADGTAIRTLVVHRAVLTNSDAERLLAIREQIRPAPKVVLCVGPHARYAELDRWGPLVDVVLPEATAREAIVRHLAGAEELARSAGPRPWVSVVSSNFELRNVLADACEQAGYPTRRLANWSSATAEDALAVWDVPVLESDWPGLFGSARTVVALLGFADRALVRMARNEGAAACLDLPCDPADLVFVLDRLVAANGGRELPHAVPPAPAGLRKRRGDVKQGLPGWRTDACLGA